MSKVLLVGELNPYGADPVFALYHLPRHASGNRLREHLGLSDVDYEALDKVNLCTGRWTARHARAGADRVLDSVASDGYEAVVLLGGKVRDAFKGPAFFESHRVGLQVSAGNVEEVRAFQLVTLPHPSGRNLLWNHKDARTRARLLLKKVAPSVPWGEHEDI